MKQLFDFILPAAWRRRKVPDGDRNDAVLSRLSDQDPVYRALMDHAYEQFEIATQSALQETQDGHALTPEQRAFRCGWARGLAAYVASIEGYSVRARAELARQMEQQQKRKER